MAGTNTSSVPSSLSVSPPFAKFDARADANQRQWPHQQRMGFEAEALVALLQGSPFAMPALSLLVFCGAICPVPGLFSSSLVAAGFTLGFWRGFAAVYPAAVLGAVLSFTAGRRFGARWRAYIPTKVATLCEAIGDGGFFMLLLLRLTPLTVCASAGFLGCANGRTASRPRVERHLLRFPSFEATF